MNLPVLSNFRIAVVAARRGPRRRRCRRSARRDDVVRLIEVVGRRRAAGLAERQQQLAVGAELEDLMPVGRARHAGRSARRRRGCAARPPARAPRCGSGALSWPSVTQTLPSRSTWMPCGKISMPGAEALHQLADGIELQNRSAAPTSCRPRDRGTCSAPQRSATQIDLAVLVDLDGARRSPRAAFRQLGPAFDALIRIRRVVGRAGVRLRPRAAPGKADDGDGAGEKRKAGRPAYM